MDREGGIMINCGKKRRLNKYRKFNTLYLNWSYPKYNRPQDIKQLKKMLQNSKRNDHKPITSWNGIEIQNVKQVDTYIDPYNDMIDNLISEIVEKPAGYIADNYKPENIIEAESKPLQMQDCELPAWGDAALATDDIIKDLARDVPIILSSPELTELAGKGEFIKLSEG